MNEEVGSRLTALFLEELEEHLTRMNADVLALESDPHHQERLRSLFRSAHTIKGAARAAGVPLVEGTCHALEGILAEARDGRRTLGESEFSLLFASVDALADAGERLRAGASLADAPVASLVRSLQESERGAAMAPPRARPRREEAAAPPRPGGDEVRERVRLEPGKLDALLASASELLVMAGRLEMRLSQGREVQDRAGRCATAWRRLQRGLRSALEDPIVRRSEAAFDGSLDRLLAGSGRLASDAMDDAAVLARLTRDLGERMQALRMRPFTEACEGLPRAVRDLARAEGKDVRLDVVGRAVEADILVLDVVREALLHLVRNAVDHGIEAPDLRRQRGKPPSGTVAVAAELKGDRLLVTVEDDGGGIDVEAVRAQVEPSSVTSGQEDEWVARRLLEGGLSTRAEATSISGRGVGLDAVRAAVERVHGRVELQWKPGEGSRFTLDCPVQLAAVRALLVRVGEQVFAFPSTDVERLVHVSPGDIRRANGRDVLADPGGPVPLVSLARLLGPPLVSGSPEGRMAAVRLRSGRRRLAVAVDELLSEQELVVRPLRPLRQPPPHIAGAALLGTGDVAVLLDSAAVVAAGLSEGAAGAALERSPATEPRKRILLADDSITTRTLEESILEAAGYDVVTAADGSEAWKLLQEEPCDLVVSDVEMPRMDGFELCEAIRSSRRLSELPVVLVTALESAEHRARGFEVGADAYIGKSSFDQAALLEAIHRLIG